MPFRAEVSYEGSDEEDLLLNFLDCCKNLVP